MGALHFAKVKVKAMPRPPKKEVRNIGPKQIMPGYAVSEWHYDMEQMELHDTLA